MLRATLHALAQAMIVLIGTVVLGIMISFLFGSLILEPVTALCAALFEEVTAWRLTRAIELLLYGCAGVVMFRYLARFFPHPCEVGKAKYGWLRTSSGIVAALVAVVFGSIGAFGLPELRLAPTLVLVITLGALIWRHIAGETFSRPAGTVLFLRRFAGFADRSVVSSVLRAAPRGGNVTFLIAAQEPASNWDPWSLGLAGFRLFNPLTSIPTYHVSADETWGENVARLIRNARCVAMDLSDFSASIAHELSLLVEHSMLSRTVFVAREDVDRTLLRAKLLKAGLDPQAFFDRLYFYRRSWPRTLLRVLLMTAVAAAVSIPIWTLIVPGLTIIRVGEAVILCLGVLLYCRAVVLRFSISGRSKREIRSRIRQALSETAADYRASPVATDLFEAAFGCACGAPVIGILFAAVGYSNLTLTFGGSSGLVSSPGRYYPERAADYLQIGTFLGMVLGTVCALSMTRKEPRRYSLRRTVVSALISFGIMLVVMGLFFGVPYLILRIQGQQGSFRASMTPGLRFIWIALVGLLAVAMGAARQYGKIEETKR